MAVSSKHKLIFNTADFDIAPRINHNGSITVRFQMPVSITLKNIPDDIYQKLKAVAESNRRSLNSEAIVCLEAVLKKPRLAASEHLARIRAITSDIDTKQFKARDIDSFKRAGRK
jgi:antitoxin FitA